MMSRQTVIAEAQLLYFLQSLAGTLVVRMAQLPRRFGMTEAGQTVLPVTWHVTPPQQNRLFLCPTLRHHRLPSHLPRIGDTHQGCRRLLVYQRRLHGAALSDLGLRRLVGDCFLKLRP